MKLKLSDAIMLNGISKPQGYGFATIGSPDSPCALGGALQAIGKQAVDDCGGTNYLRFQSEWPWTRIDWAKCPACGIYADVMETIWKLNDVHNWTRQQIAEWVARIEPQEPEQTIEELVETAEVVHELP